MISDNEVAIDKGVEHRHVQAESEEDRNRLSEESERVTVDLEEERKIFEEELEESMHAARPGFGPKLSRTDPSLMRAAEKEVDQLPASGVGSLETCSPNFLEDINRVFEQIKIQEDERAGKADQSLEETLVRENATPRKIDQEDEGRRGVEHQENEERSVRKMRQDFEELSRKLDRETERAMKAEKDLARKAEIQASALRDFDAFLSVGDEMARNRIIIRSLLAQTQGKLASQNGLTTSSDPFVSAGAWIKYCDTFGPDTAARVAEPQRCFKARTPLPAPCLF